VKEAFSVDIDDRSRRRSEDKFKEEMTMKTSLRKGHLISLATTAVAGIALVGLPTAAPAATVTPYAAHVTVNLSCQAGGRYAWTVSLVDAAPNKTYLVTYKYTEYGPNGGGGLFDFKSMGNLNTGTYGIGSSTTMTRYGPTNLTKVTVTGKVAGLTASATDTC
jgi:hypothetical protein